MYGGDDGAVSRRVGGDRGGNEAALAEAERAHDATMLMVREVDAAALAAWRADVEAIREGHAAAIAAAAEKTCDAWR